MSPRQMPRWVAAVQRKILAQPGIAESPRCERCGRLTYLSDWDQRENCCVECSVERSRAFEMQDEGPFLPSAAPAAPHPRCGGGGG